MYFRESVRKYIFFCLAPSFLDFLAVVSQSLEFDNSFNFLEGSRVLFSRASFSRADINGSEGTISIIAGCYFSNWPHIRLLKFFSSKTCICVDKF